MEVLDMKTAQGHWILAKMGKKVLRPGGKELTQKLIENLDITNKDNVIEFAPGLGFTAAMAIAKNPHSYTGVDADVQAVVLLNNKIKGDHIRFINGNAESVELPEASATKVYGEAMLTMHADHRKEKIISEAYRLLKPGGLYAIHEIGLTPNGISEELKGTIQKDLSKCIHVNARPLTVDEWTQLIEKSGFEVIKVETNGMYLLETKRFISDEGFFRSLKIAYNIYSNPEAKKRIMAMRKVFRQYQKDMNSIVIVAKKL
ncbi:MAG: methyltransferase domain-containing protein [Flavobacteriales bacterium]|nr:methyltransferase domain-containing protein [Flavobacteriales bacterium]